MKQVASKWKKYQYQNIAYLAKNWHHYSPIIVYSFFYFGLRENSQMFSKSLTTSYLFFPEIVFCLFSSLNKEFFFIKSVYFFLFMKDIQKLTHIPCTRQYKRTL